MTAALSTAGAGSGGIRVTAAFSTAVAGSGGIRVTAALSSAGGTGAIHMQSADTQE